MFGYLPVETALVRMYFEEVAEVGEGSRAFK